MSQKSSIEWTDATWNPVRGCTKISPGCKHCYARTFAERFRGVPGHPYEQGFDLRLVPEKLPDPLGWKTPRKIFVNSMSDLFHPEVPDEYIVQVCETMLTANWHQYQVLTKRTKRMAELLNTKLAFAAKHEHIWWGTSVEDRQFGLPRISVLKTADVSVRFLSVEPLLEDLGSLDLTRIHWMIVGGESGAGARPISKSWVQSLQRQCEKANVAFFFKQWGGVRKNEAGRLLDGVVYDQLPILSSEGRQPVSEVDADYEKREQAQIKHYALKGYLEGAARIIGSFRNFRFVDCCAGPWESRSPQHSDTSFGIGCQSLAGAQKELIARGKSVKFSALLIEKNPESFKDLERYVRLEAPVGIDIRAENWDFTQHLPEILDFSMQKDSFPFFFIDPWGWNDAGLSKIKPILQVKPGEVLINLMSSFLSRFVNDSNCDLTDLLGEDVPEIRKLAGPEREDAIIRKYCDLVKAAGDYRYVCALPVMHGRRDCFAYYLIYATRHRKGVKVFKDVERRTESETHVIRADVQFQKRALASSNLELFDAPVLYKERCYRELSTRNQDRARNRVLEVIEKQHQVEYDECWAEALQYSAVHELHVRAWLGKWEQEGRIVVKGRKRAREVLKVDSGHVVVRKADFYPIDSPYKTTLFD